jgi:hypothetical protein
VLHTQDTATITTANSTATSTQVEDQQTYKEIPILHSLLDGNVTKWTHILKDVFVHSWSNEKQRIEDKSLEAKMI